MERHHHRSKSQLAKSLLHKVSSPKDSVKSNDDTPDNSLSHQPDGSSVASDSNVSLRTPNRLSRSRSQNAPTASSSLADSGIISPPQSENMPPPPTGPVGLEQSVRLFRYVEALRSGDNEAIAKAIKEQEPGSSARLYETSLLHLAIQCAEFPVIERVLENTTQSGKPATALNARDKDGNTPLHLAARLGRVPVVRALLEQDGINDSISNLKGETALDVAYSADIFQELQLARSLYVDSNVRKINSLVAQRDYGGLEKLLNDSRIRTTIDLNGMELATDRSTLETGGTLLHEAARKRDVKLIQLLLMNGADPFRRDRKGKLAQDVTKDEKTRHILKRSPAAEAAKRTVQEKSILGAGHSQAGSSQNLGESPLGGKESREMKGYLKKWTNYTSGWKLRWFVLEEGVLSYYKHQDDAGAACRGAINMRIAKLNMDPQDKLRFEIQGKSSVKYHLKANHQVEAKRWYWALNNAIQWTKDEDKEEQKRVDREAEALKHAKAARDGDSSSQHSTRTRSGNRGQSLTIPAVASSAASGTNDDDDGGRSLYESSIGAAATRTTSKVGVDASDEDEELCDDASSHEVQPVQKDALNIAAQSVKLQLDLLAHVTASLSEESKRNPDLTFSDPLALQAISTYVSAVGNLKGLIGDFMRITNDREAYWQYLFDRESNIRMMWEESMAKVAKEQEVLENRMGEVEDKRKRTKRALRDALENLAVADSGPTSPPPEVDVHEESQAIAVQQSPVFSPTRRKPTFADLQDISDSDSDDEEFFDAVGAGEVEVVEMDTTVCDEAQVPPTVLNTRDATRVQIKRSFKGYEDDVRTKLKMDADDRPKISLWGILKGMIGRDMTRMTLPVSFNEPTSLLQRVAEDMEYTALLDKAAELVDSTERMLYVAAFAASEYASTIGRVAKPFNPLLGETYEYARPDRGFRFFIEQVSHHPPIGAAYAESSTWDYYGESAVKSKFYGKSFDINPLGTWFLNLRPKTGVVERYTWKKVTSSVVGIISGSPTVDNYGTMVIKNWTTGEVCTLEFKPRGWKASSAYIVNGRVLDSDGKTRWSVGGRWNDKIYARLTPGYEDNTFVQLDFPGVGSKTGRTDSISSSQAFLVWEANGRPSGIPFNLTPFGLTLNALPDRLRPHLAPTDTRLRPDQRAMEDGEYDFAATEKNRLEEKQRATRRRREQRGEAFVPRWFAKATCEVTGEEYWKFNGGYWGMRERVANGGKWEGLEDIF